jgi:hypothetical protein
MIRKLLAWLLARWRYNPATADVDIMGAASTRPADMSIGAILETHTSKVVQAIKLKEARTETPLADALSKPIVLPDVPKQTVTVKGEWQQQTGDYGIDLEASVDIGKPGGWEAGGKGGWWKSKGAAAMGWLQWKGK